MTIADLAQRWLSAAEHRVGASTYAGYAAHVRLYIVSSIGSHRAEALRPAHVEGALASWWRQQRNDGEKGVLSLAPSLTSTTRYALCAGGA